MYRNTPPKRPCYLLREGHAIHLTSADGGSRVAVLTCDAVPLGSSELRGQAQVAMELVDLQDVATFVVADGSQYFEVAAVAA